MARRSDGYEIDDDLAHADPGLFRLVQDTRDDVDKLKARIGRDLLAAEVQALCRGVIEQADRGVPIDIEAALLKETGATAKSVADMSRAEVLKHQMAKAQELTQPEEIDEDREFDLADPDDMRDYMRFRAQGGDDYEPVYFDVEVEEEEAEAA